MVGLFAVMFWVQVSMIARPCADMPRTAINNDGYESNNKTAQRLDTNSHVTDRFGDFFIGIAMFGAPQRGPDE